MTSRELYEKYKGRKASCTFLTGTATGIICGYDKHTYDTPFPLVMAITSVPDLYLGWMLNDNAIIDTHKNNLMGYRWIDETHILLED